MGVRVDHGSHRPFVWRASDWWIPVVWLLFVGWIAHSIATELSSRGVSC